MTEYKIAHLSRRERQRQNKLKRSSDRDQKVFRQQDYELEYEVDYEPIEWDLCHIDYDYLQDWNRMKELIVLDLFNDWMLLNY